MQEDPRFLIGNHIYRIDMFFNVIVQVGNIDNNIAIPETSENRHSFGFRIDPDTGKFLTEISGDHGKEVLIPRSVLEVGYMECSRFAENFNAKLSDKFGIRLVDDLVLKEMEDIIIPLPEQVFPIIEKNGLRFEIDVSLNEIRNVDNPFIHIDLDRLHEENGKYIVYLSDDGSLYSWDQGNSLKLEINQLVKIAPDEVAKVYGLTKDQLPATDKLLRSNPVLLQNRIEKGCLPIIKIVDEDYYVDLRMQELRSCSKFWKTVKLIDNGPEAEEVDSKYVYLYDYLNRKIVKNFNLLDEVPKHTIFIVLPDYRTLDPVAAGRLIYNDPHALLHKYPLQSQMEARLVPIDKTYLLDLIQKNKERKLAEKNNKAIKPLANTKVIKPGKKNNKNNGLPF